jgi:SAM-dependent methyltransferase
LILAALGLIAIVYVLNQSRKPTRWVGRFFVWAMNMSHSGLTDWGLEHVQVEKGFTILDVGCGGGRTVQKLAAIATEGRVCGVDFAAGSVAHSRAKNAQLIQAGRVEIQQASVSRMPFPDGQFDLVTAVETLYYWPDPAQDMREVLRVVKPGGTLLVIAEIYKHGTHDWLHQLPMTPLRGTVLSADEHRELFAAAGFADVLVFEERSKGWICVTGRKPVSVPTG